MSGYQESGSIWSTKNFFLKQWNYLYGTVMVDTQHHEFVKIYSNLQHI